ncbi:MAG TPA: acetate/propionate family kinase [Gaiellaceae bacterium]|nr:acetate/propionate family kinase [Gaiellaceae bacterium]
MGAILVVNAGSTSLKLRVVSDAEDVDDVESLDAARAEDLSAVGHRVVHGGRILVEPTMIDDAVRTSIADLESIAPLHNAPALAGIDAATRVFPEVPHVAVFDTAFHVTMPVEAATYALPLAWREEWGVRRFGFHGLSVHWCAEKARALLERSQLRLVVCHLGGGCSVTAVRDGRSVDTTMGFSPLDGVPMATRSGSIDPGALLYLQRERGLSVDELDRALNEDSGLEGLSGLSGDVRDLEAAAAAGHSNAGVALAVFTYRIAGAVAAMAASLGGLDVLAFTAGVGEHSASVRRAVCARLGFLNVELDDDLNDGDPTDADVATPNSAVRVLVVAAREELIVARAVRSVLGQPGGSRSAV